MFRLWGKVFQNNKLLRDTVYENDDPSMSRTQKVLAGLEAICRELDLSVPIWLDANIKDFQRVSRCRFLNDSFIQESGFDFLEIQVIEED